MPEITRKIKYARCGKCGEAFKRDDLHSLNAKFYSPDDREAKIPIRLCSKCREEEEDRLNSMKWQVTNTPTTTARQAVVIIRCTRLKRGMAEVRILLLHMVMLAG